MTATPEVTFARSRRRRAAVIGGLIAAAGVLALLLFVVLDDGGGDDAAELQRDASASDSSRGPRSKGSDSSVEPEVAGERQEREGGSSAGPGAAEATSARDDAPARKIDVHDVGVGDCLTMPTDTFVDEVQVMGCDLSHEVEVVGTYQLGGTTYPGYRPLNDQAYEGCQSPFEAYVGIVFSQSRYDLGHVTPTPSSWRQEGDRQVVCLAFDPSGEPLSRSIRGTRT